MSEPTPGEEKKPLDYGQDPVTDAIIELLEKQR